MIELTSKACGKVYKIWFQFLLSRATQILCFFSCQFCGLCFLGNLFIQSKLPNLLESYFITQTFSRCLKVVQWYSIFTDNEYFLFSWSAYQRAYHFINIFEKNFLFYWFPPLLSKFTLKWSLVSSLSSLSCLPTVFFGFILLLLFLFPVVGV